MLDGGASKRGEINVAAWVLSSLLAVAFLGAGGMKAAIGRDKAMANPRLAWAEDFTDPQVRGIGTLEVLGAVGLILPWLLDIARILTPLAALGLVALMVGALLTHGRRGELKQAIPVNTVLAVLALVVAAIRFTQL